MARLDALGPVKELAQLGSVLGREFDYALLLAVSPMKEAELQSALAAAVREELFYQRGTPPEASYHFKHALIRDAAYESLLRTTRREHHRRVAETLIERMPVVAEGQPELVAHHLTEAGAVERSLDYWQRAAERANARAAYEESILHSRRGLGALESSLGAGTGADRELSLLMALATALVAARGYSNPETKQAWERALTACDPATDPIRSAVVNYQLGNTLASWGDPRSALAHYTEALRIGEAAGDERSMVAGHYGRATALYFIGRIGESCEHIHRAISLYDPQIHRFDQPGYTEDPGIGSWCEAGWHLWFGGVPDRAAEAARRGVELARESQQPYSLAFALAWAAVTAAFRRELVEARALASEAAAFSDEQGFPMLAGVSRIVGAWAEGLEGRDPAAIDRLLAAMGEASATGQQGGAPQMLCYLAELQLKHGRLAEAVGSLGGALAIAAQTGEAYFDAELHRLKGEIFLTQSDHGEEEGEREFQSALEIARTQQARSFELRAATSLARLWRDQGKRAEARDLLEPVYDVFTEGFDTQDLKDAKALLEQLA
jgi:predicted ATPase